MNTFSSLLKHRNQKAPGEVQKMVRSHFPKQVSQSKFKLRKPSDSFPLSGKHFIIGVATYSVKDLGLLDQLEESLENSDQDIPDIKVFDVLDCETMGDFDKFIPGIQSVYRTPVIGVILDGKLIDHATGLSEVMDTLRRFKVLDLS
jgi:hypothetical protein